MADMGRIFFCDVIAETRNLFDSLEYNRKFFLTEDVEAKISSDSKSETRDERRETKGEIGDRRESYVDSR